MKPETKIRLGALLAAMAVTAILAGLLGPVMSGVAHLLQHGYAALSPKGQAIARAIGGSLPYWLPGTVIAVVVAVSASRRRRRDDADDEAAHRERRRIAGRG